jgi:5-methylcytosine-specific restriction protein A
MMADNFQTELTAQIERASQQGRPHLEINAGELHRAVGGYPPRGGAAHRMPRCCNVMRDEFRRGEAEVIGATASGDPLALTIRYSLPRPPHA